jgi:hypothetical protein
MTEQGLFMLADALINAVLIGLEADMLKTKVKEMEAAGKSAAEIAGAIKAMRDLAILQAQDAIDRA